VSGDEPPAHDRTEVDLFSAAAVSDRGHVHSRNEDSFHLDVLGDRTVVAVVCDGISSASAGNVAARSAASTAGRLLVQAASDADRDLGAAMTEAIEAAGGAVAEVPWTTRSERVDPSCTLVSALRRGDQIVIGWVGDSRAYWIDAGGVRQLTVDDSFAEEGIAAGLLTPEEAARSPFLHSITHWVGPASPDRPPRVTVIEPETPGRVLLCTDGLWNYMSTTAELGAFIDSLPNEATPGEVARALTDAALARGGEDNITVAVIDVA
jgi:serine/threonine protein phosphatase PrpC